MRRVIFICIFSNEQRGAGGGALPDFFFSFFFPVQQTTSGIGHRASSFFGLATNALNVRNNNNNSSVTVGFSPILYC